MPSVTIIIPNYNHSRYLHQRIDSVLQQSYSNFELIILDDCSQDNSRDIITEYTKSDSRIKVFFNKKNSGSTFKQWNKGIALAKGEYIWLAESDDYADSNLLETLVNKLEADKSIGLAYCNSWDVDEESQVIGDKTDFYKSLDPELWTRDFLLEGKWLVETFMSYRNIIPNASAVVMRKSILEQVGLADESFRLNGDWLLWAKISLLSNVAFVAERLNYFRQHTNNVRSATNADGTALVELTRLLKKLNNMVSFRPFFLQVMISTLVAMWLEGIIKYNISYAKNNEIYRNLKCAESNLNKRILLEFTKIYPSKMSGIKQLLGDGLLYKYVLKHRRKK